MASKKGKSICLFSAKGGVGKTTTAVNLAGVCKLLNKKVLIVDLDFNSSGVAICLNKPFMKSIYNLAIDITENKYTDFNDYITKYDDNIDFLAGPKDPRCANKISSKFVDIILDRATYLYDVVIIDTNHYLGEVNLTTLDKVDEILFLLTNDPIDVKNSKSLLSIFNELEVDKYKVLLNDSRDPYKDYFSMYDIRNIIGANIDYNLSASMYLKDMENYVMAGKILTLDKKMSTVLGKDYNTFMTILLDLLESGEVDE